VAGNAVADNAWADLKAAQRGALKMSPGRREIVAPSVAQGHAVRAEREAARQRLRGLEERAREFHVRFPQHAQAASARRLELLTGLRAISEKDKDHKRRVLAGVAAFRRDPAIPVAARFAVAHAMESRELSKQILGRPWFVNPVRAEMMLDRLRAEFDEAPQVWAGYLALAENTYCDAGRDVAHRIVQSEYAPESTRRAAQRILERFSLVGRRFDYVVTPRQGAPTTIPQLAGRTTIVCFWDGVRQPEGPPGLGRFAQSPLPNTRWIYVAVGEPAETPKGKRRANAPPGTTCVEAKGWRSPLVKRLQITRLPYAFVLDDQARLSGYGGLEEISQLIAGIGRRILP
jgi:hypothetical protein